MMSSKEDKIMKWTKNKPDNTGYYWRRMKADKNGLLCHQVPHVIDIQEQADGELAVHEWSSFGDWDFQGSLHFMKNDFEYAGPIPFPGWD